MKPYYKQGGFFDRLERLSDWIDNEIDRPFGLKRIAERIDYYIYLINSLSNKNISEKNFVDRELARIELGALRLKLSRYLILYSKRKYWWMREK